MFNCIDVNFFEKYTIRGFRALVHDIEYSSICISNVVMTVTISSGYYDIMFTTELVCLGFDSRCVEDLGDAFLQAGVVDGVIDGLRDSSTCPEK